jgi:hypothetical protein
MVVSKLVSPTAKKTIPEIPRLLSRCKIERKAVARRRLPKSQSGPKTQCQAKDFGLQ